MNNNQQQHASGREENALPLISKRRRKSLKGNTSRSKVLGAKSELIFWDPFFLMFFTSSCSSIHCVDRCWWVVVWIRNRLRCDIMDLCWIRIKKVVVLMIMCWCRIDFWKSLLGFVLDVLDEHSSSSSRVLCFDLKMQRERKRICLWWVGKKWMIVLTLDCDWTYIADTCNCWTNKPLPCGVTNSWTNEKLTHVLD